MCVLSVYVVYSAYIAFDTYMILHKFSPDEVCVPESKPASQRAEQEEQEPVTGDKNKQASKRSRRRTNATDKCPYTDTSSCISRACFSAVYCGRIVSLP